MKLYTKTGDDGSTTPGGGRRVRKSDIRCEAIGTVDELNAHVGLAVELARVRGLKDLHDALAPVQSELFRVGAALADPKTPHGPTPAAIDRLERCIDHAWETLPELDCFVLPGGCAPACELHVARTLCRRAERRAVACADAGIDLPPTVLTYLNRLSDALFALARAANAQTNVPDVPWSP